MSKEQLYGAAFGFNTERRVKPIHFATGLFLALTKRYFGLTSLNKTVALDSNKEMLEDYATPNLLKLLRDEKRVRSDFDARSLHELRRHLTAVANNDEAVYPVFAPYSGFGNDYSLVSARFITCHKRNDGFAGFFVHEVLRQSPAGRKILESASTWLSADQSALQKLFRPLLDEEDASEDWNNDYDAKFEALDGRRLKRVAVLMKDQTEALERLCSNISRLFAPETRLRCLIIGLLVWLFHYLLREPRAKGDPELILFMDFSEISHSRLRAQSRWSFVRNREALLESFVRFEKSGRFGECEDDFEILAQHPKFPLLDDIYRELALRSGLAQPRANAVPKHFQLQPDTLRVLVLSLIDSGSVIELPELAEKLRKVWSVFVGASADDAETLARAGYAGLDQREDLTANADAFVGLLVGMGLAITPADGLVLCATHSEDFQ